MRKGQIFRVCLCADDFGLSAAVSRGIVTALAAGRLSATSAITTLPDWPASAPLLSAFGATADIGMHINLTLAAPLTSMPAFAPAGNLPKFGQIFRAAQQNLLPHAEIAAEIAAQLDAFAEACGRYPDFVDGHQHIHVLPGIRSALFEVLKGKGLTDKVWLRNSADHPWRIFSRRGQIKKALAVSWISRRFAAAASTQGFKVNDGFAGFSNFSETRDYGSDFAQYLAAPGSAHLIMCHPGHVDDALIRLDPVTRSREKELAFLLSPRFPECLSKLGAALTPLKQIL